MVEHEEEEAQENLSHTRSLTMIFLRALRVSFVLFVTQKAFESKVNSIGRDLTKYFNLQFAQAIQHKPGPYQATPAAMVTTAGMIRLSQHRLKGGVPHGSPTLRLCKFNHLLLGVVALHKMSHYYET